VTYTIKATDVPKPTVAAAGPEYGGVTTIVLLEKGEVDLSNAASWEQALTTTGPVFDFTNSVAADTLSVSTTINAVSDAQDAASIRTFVFTATDGYGNAGSCEVRVHVADADECMDGTHTCDATVVCENLDDTRGDPGDLSDHVVLGTYQCMCPSGFDGDGYSACVDTLAGVVDACKTRCRDGPSCCWNGQCRDNRGGCPDHWHCVSGCDLYVGRYVGQYVSDAATCEEQCNAFTGNSRHPSYCREGCSFAAQIVAETQG
jgi:hypothetical protein